MKRLIKNIFRRRFKFIHCKYNDGLEEYIDVRVEYNDAHIGNINIDVDADYFCVYCEDFVLEEILCAHFVVEDLCDVHLFKKIHNKYKYKKRGEIKW